LVDIWIWDDENILTAWWICCWL